MAQRRVAAQYAQQRSNWKVVFRAVYELVPQSYSVHYCEHCHDMHPMRDQYVHDPKLDEAYWAYCACPDCDAGSWNVCQYYNDFLYEDG